MDPLLERSPADVGIVTGPEVDWTGGDGVFVPFGGTQHDWAALELAAGLAAAADVPIRLVGTRASSGRRDASRLLANASIAVQRVAGVVADPVLADATEHALVEAVAPASLVVAGMRTPLAGSIRALVLVHAGPRPGMLAPRAAWLQLGAMIGTVMAANVFVVIIPAHWELIRAKEAGREPDPAPALQAKQRSVHNNYLTLPVLLTMLAGHFPFAYGADNAWLVLVALMVIGGWARLFFNLRHAGRTYWWMPVAGLVAFVALAIAVDRSDDSTEPAATPADVAQGKQVFLSAGCASCHTLADAGATGTVGPSLDAAQPSASLVAARVREGKGVMPSFAGSLDDAEIAAVAAYVSAAAAG
jgi:mono/diheme cytochrome c family protein